MSDAGMSDEYVMVQPLSSEEQVEQQKLQAAQEQKAAATAQTPAAAGGDDMQVDDGTDASPSDAAAGNDVSVEERRMQDTTTTTAGTTGTTGAADNAAALADQEVAQQSEARRIAEARLAAAAADLKRRAARVPTLMRLSCHRCHALISYPSPTRLVHCAVCAQVNAVPAQEQEEASAPTAQLSLREQAAQWNTMQVTVFLKSLKLEHVTHIFDQNHVDGKQLLDLSYYDIRDVLRIQKPTDIDNVLNCINILRGADLPPVATPDDLVKKEAAAAAAGAATQAAAPAVATAPAPAPAPAAVQPAPVQAPRPVQAAQVKLEHSPSISSSLVTEASSPSPAPVQQSPSAVSVVTTAPPSLTHSFSNGVTSPVPSVSESMAHFVPQTANTTDHARLMLAQAHVPQPATAAPPASQGSSQGDAMQQ